MEFVRCFVVEGEEVDELGRIVELLPGLVHGQAWFGLGQIGDELLNGRHNIRNGVGANLIVSVWWMGVDTSFAVKWWGPSGRRRVSRVWDLR